MLISILPTFVYDDFIVLFSFLMIKNTLSIPGIQQPVNN